MITGILLFVIFLNFIASILVISVEESSLENRLFSLVSFSASLWAFATYMTGVSHAPLSLLSTYASSVLVIGSTFLWIEYLVRRRLTLGAIVPLVFYSLILGGASFVPHFLAHRIDAIYQGGVFSGEAGWGLYVYLFFFFALVLRMLGKLFTAWRKASDAKRVFQFAYIFWGIVSVFCLILVTQIILPKFGIYKFGALPTIGFLLFLTGTAYSIIRHETLNAKIITAELAIFSLWAFVLIQVFALDTRRDQISGVFLLCISVAVGMQLRKSVVAEIRQKDRLESLTEELQSANVELTKLNMQKTEFLSFATHQLRNPLAALHGYAEMLGEGSAGKISKKQREITSAMSEAASHLSSTVEDFLSAAKIEQGGMQYHKEKFNFEELVSSLVHEMEFPARTKRLTLTFNSRHKKPAIIFGDSKKIRAAVENLLDNAIKYTKTGSVAVSLSQKNTGSILLEVSDTGIGMSSEDLARVFEKFGRGAEGQRAAQGSGIGLYLAKEVVEAHGGEIGAESPGKDLGSVFYMLFPLEQA